MTNEQVFTAVRQATEAVFSTMLNLHVSPKDACEQVDPPPLNGVMAVLGFTGEWVGTGMFYCQEKLACRLSSTMLATQIGEITNEVLDGMGELANVVLGNVKDHLHPVAGELAMSIPTVVYGRNFQTRTTGNRNWLIAAFAVEEDTFEIRLCLAPKK